MSSSYSRLFLILVFFLIAGVFSVLFLFFSDVYRGSDEDFSIIFGIPFILLPFSLGILLLKGRIRVAKIIGIIFILSAFFMVVTIYEFIIYEFGVFGCKYYAALCAFGAAHLESFFLEAFLGWFVAVYVLLLMIPSQLGALAKPEYVFSKLLRFVLVLLIILVPPIATYDLFQAGQQFSEKQRREIAALQSASGFRIINEELVLTSRLQDDGGRIKNVKIKKVVVHAELDIPVTGGYTIGASAWSLNDPNVKLDSPAILVDNVGEWYGERSYSPQDWTLGFGGTINQGTHKVTISFLPLQWEPGRVLDEVIEGPYHVNFGVYTNFGAGDLRTGNIIEKGFDTRFYTKSELSE